MDKLARVNKLMHDWASYVKEGQTCAGVFQTSAWSAGKPVKAPQRHASRRHKQKPLVPAPVPHDKRTLRPKIPCTRIAYREERVHRIVMKLPEYVRPVICCLWIRGDNYGDAAVLLGIKSKQVVKIKRKVLKAIDSML